jgi:uridine phosphorylase
MTLTERSGHAMMDFMQNQGATIAMNTSGMKIDQTATRGRHRPGRLRTEKRYYSTSRVSVASSGHGCVSMALGFQP